MKLRLLAIGIVVGVLAGLAWPLVASTRDQIGPTIGPDKLRFRMVGDEPIATPDGRSVLTGWKAVLLRDTQTDQCYVVLLAGSTTSIAGSGACQPPTP